MMRYLLCLLGLSLSVFGQAPYVRNSLDTNATSTNLLFEPTTKRTGINTASPPTALSVVGDGDVLKGIYVGTGAIGNDSNFILWQDGTISHIQFGTHGGFTGDKLYLGTELTSIPGVWPVTINQGASSGKLGINIVSPSVELDVLGSGRISSSLAANAATFTNSLTLPFGTASTLLSLNGSKAVVAIANGTGALTNDGSGNFGYASMTGDVTNTYNTQITTNLTVVNSATISNINYISGKGNKVYITNSIQLGDYYLYPLLAGNGISLSTNANPTSGTNLTATVTNVTEAQLTLAANTTADVSTTKHGFAPVLPNDATKFLNGVGTYTVPAGGISGSGTANRVAKWSSSSALGNATPTDDGSIWDFGNVMSTVRIPDGSAPIPGLAFSIQTNLGIARLADTTLSIIAGGAEVVAFGNGNFGSYNGLKFSPTATMKMPSGAGAGKVLTSDAAGAASWQNILSVNATNVTTPNIQDTATVTWARSLSNLTANAQPSAILDVLGSTRGSILYRGASGWAALPPGTAGYALTANGAGADPTYQAIPSGGLVTSASQFAIVGGSASGTANGTALLAAYTVAQTATPNGNALAANNRYTIYLLDGVYDLGSSTLTMDTPFVDIVGLGAPAWQSTAAWSATDNGNTIITSSSGTATITVSATSSQDVLLARLAIVNSGSGKAFNSSADANNNTKLLQVLIVNTGSTNNDGMTQNRSFNGLYIDCICRNYDSFGTGTGDAGGKFYRCKTRANSFGGSVSGGTGTASGQFWDCEADGDSFGKQTSSGKFFRCRMVTINTGGDVFGLASGGTASGTYIECQGGDGTASFAGNGGTMSGLMVGCFPSTGTATTLAQASVTGEIRNCPLYIGWNGPYAMNTSDSTQISNTAAESNFSTTKSIAASAWKVGRAFTWQAWGKYSCTNVTPGTITFKTKFGATAANTSDALALPAGGTANSGWVAQGMFVCRTIGATGTVSSQSKWEMDQGTLGILNESLKPSNGTTTIANNGSLTFQLSVTFSVASASNAATIENFLLVPLDAN